MALTDYTTYDEVRAVLGVAPEEIEDETLALPLYAVMLNEGLLDMGSTLPADYATTKAVGSPTANQTRFVNLVSAWSSYQVAGQLLASIKMFAPKVVESDKDKEERVLDPYADLKEQVPAVLSTLAGRILALYAILFPANPAPALVTPINVVDVGLGVDPITGV